MKFLASPSTALTPNLKQRSVVGTLEHLRAMSGDVLPIITLRNPERLGMIDLLCSR